MEIINCSIKNKMACSFAWGRDTFGWGVREASSSWKYWALAAKVNTSIFKKLVTCQRCHKSNSHTTATISAGAFPVPQTFS